MKAYECTRCYSFGTSGDPESQRCECDDVEDALRADVERLTKELASIREVSDPDGELAPESTTRDRMMHWCEAAGRLPLAIKAADAARTERDDLRTQVARLTATIESAANTARAEVTRLEGALQCEAIRAAGNWREVERVRKERDEISDAFKRWRTDHAAQLAAALAERDEARAVLSKLVDCFDDDTIAVEHTERELDTPKRSRIGNECSADAWFEPVCGDDHDACTRETCPAIWVVNDAARIARKP